MQLSYIGSHRFPRAVRDVKTIEFDDPGSNLWYLKLSDWVTSLAAVYLHNEELSQTAFPGTVSHLIHNQHNLLALLSRAWGAVFRTYLTVAAIGTKTFVLIGNWGTCSVHGIKRFSALFITPFSFPSQCLPTILLVFIFFHRKTPRIEKRFGRFALWAKCTI